MKNLVGDENGERRKSQMPAVRRSKTLEGWDQICASRRIAAILLPRLWSSFLTLVNCPPSNSLFSESSWRFSSRDGATLLKDTLIPRLNEVQLLAALPERKVERIIDVE